jgi:hypothetical protein
MELSLIELNELIYCVGTATRHGNLVDKKVANRLWVRLNEELERKAKLYDLAENGPEVEQPESMFNDIWCEGHDKEFELTYKPDNGPELLDEAGAVQRWG